MSCKDYNASWNRRRRAMYYTASKFPACLPARDALQAVYLGLVPISISGLISDESGNGNNAQLVNSNCVVGNGTLYGMAGTEAIHNGTSCDWEFNFKMTGSDDSLGAKRDISTDLEFYTRVFSDKFTLGLSQNGTSFVDSNFPIANLNDGLWHNVKITFNAGNLVFILDDGAPQLQTTSVTSINIGNGSLTVMSSFTFIPWRGSVAYVKMGLAEFNCAEGAGNTLFNTGVAGGNASIMGTALWGLQNFYHYNILQGFDLWTHATLADLRVPIGSVVTATGYNFISTNPAGIWHNKAESEMQLPATIKTVTDGDIPNPVTYADWETLYGVNPNFSGLSNTKEYEHKKMVFYDKYLSDEELKKALACIEASEGSDILRDVNGVPLRDVNGILLIPSS